MSRPTVHALVEDAAAARPEAVYALDASDARGISFAQLQRSCHAVSAELRALGSVPGDTVSLVMPNGLSTLELLLGAMHGGWCVNPVNLQAPGEAMRYVIEHSDCRVLIAAPEWEAPVREMLAGISRPMAMRVVDPAQPLSWAAGGTQLSPSEGDPPASATALLMYTSGTTGRPKGVMLTQASLAANACAIVAEHELTERDRVLGVLPLFHINAFAVTMLAPLASMGSVVLPPRFSASAFWPQVLATQCTWINLVPTMIAFLLEAADSPPREDLARIRFCRSASAALPVEHLHAFEQRFGIGIVETMGLTETVAPAFSNPLDAALRKPGSVGRASGGEARIVDAAFAPVADGTRGEIVIRGPHVMAGYYKNPEASAAAFTPDGWLRTGDLGHRDADGFFFVTGRLKELIIKGGENIAPREIDEVLLAHPAVLDAAVVGIPDRLYGQQVMACVVLREGHAGDAATQASLMGHCEQRLGRFKIPSQWRFVTELPRGPSGKVQRLKLAGLA